MYIYHWEISPGWEMSWLLIVHKKCCLNEHMPVESVRLWSPFSVGLNCLAGENFDIFSNVPNNVWKIKIALICPLVLLLFFTLRSRKSVLALTVRYFDFGPISLGMLCCFSSSWLFSENLRRVKIRIYLNPRPRFLPLRGWLQLLMKRRGFCLVFTLSIDFIIAVCPRWEASQLWRKAMPSEIDKDQEYLGVGRTVELPALNDSDSIQTPALRDHQILAWLLVA